MWCQGAGGTLVLIRRLLHYAGMPRHRVRVQSYTERSFSELDQHGRGHAGPGTAAWFAGIQGEVCHFGVNVTAVRRSLRLHMSRPVWRRSIHCE